VDFYYGEPFYVPEKVTADDLNSIDYNSNSASMRSMSGPGNDMARRCIKSGTEFSKEGRFKSKADYLEMRRG